MISLFPVIMMKTYLQSPCGRITDSDVVLRQADPDSQDYNFWLGLWVLAIYWP